MKDIIFPITYKSDDKGLKVAEDQLSGFGAVAAGAFAHIGAMAIDAFASAARGAVDFGMESLKAAANSEAIFRGLENAAKNAGVFGDKASSIADATKALDAHSKKLGEMTGIDDELINQLKTGWLAVPGLAAKGTYGINKLAEAAADIAKGTGKDISAVAMAFTKVSGDSETALSKLNRIGIVLSDQQKQTYQDILDTNGEIAAQDYLLQQLGDKYKGAAEASANPFERLKVIFENLQETIGGALLPAFENVIPKLQDFIQSMVTSPEFKTFLDDLGTGFENLVTYLPTAFDYLQQLGNAVFPTLQSAIGTVPAALDFIATSLFGIQSSTANVSIDNMTSSMSGLKGVLDGITGTLNQITGAMQGFNSWYDKLPNWLKLLMPMGLSTWWDANVKFFHSGANANDWLSSNNVKYGTNTGAPIGRLVGQATGGETTRSGLSWVGERGPELLNLPTGAQVIPLSKIGSSSSGSTYNISVNAGMGVDGAALGEQIVTAIRKYERTSGKVFAAA